jgi:M6 family metalloprotease-like protein
MRTNLHAAPFKFPQLAADSTATFHDVHGQRVVLRVVGDKIIPIFETLEGYATLINKESGVYCYAELDDTGRLVASSVPITDDPPEDVYPGLRPLPEAIREETARVCAALKRENEENRAKNPKGPNGEATIGTNEGLLEGPQCTEGRVRGLTVLVEFEDEKLNPGITPRAVSDLMNAPNYNENGNICSVKEYFARVSNNILEYHNDVFGPYKLSRKKDYYLKHNMVPEVLQLIVDAHEADLGLYNYKDRGLVAALNILYAGSSVYEGELWPHNYHVKPHQNPDDMPNGLEFYFYQLVGVGSGMHDLRIGTICHENGHLLCRWPDLYDYGRRDGNYVKSAGIGRYCLMGSGSHNKNRRAPCPPNAHFRHLVGWTESVYLNTHANHVMTLPPIQEGLGLHYVYELPGKDNETFVLENRRRHDLNAYSPADGLAIFHCDIYGSNEWEQGTEAKHYQVALIQADGREELEKNINYGDAGDMFRPGQSVSGISASEPNTRTWSGVDSGLSVKVEKFLEDGSIRVRIGKETGQAHNVTKSAFPGKEIPDNFPAGISDALTLVEGEHAEGLIDQVTVSCVIHHTYRGDLRVVLRHGNDGKVVAKPESFDGRDNIIIRDMDVTEAFRGGTVGGHWVLGVSDNVRRDYGRLVSWKLDVVYHL